MRSRDVCLNLFLPLDLHSLCVWWAFLTSNLTLHLLLQPRYRYRYRFINRIRQIYFGLINNTICNMFLDRQFFIALYCYCTVYSVHWTDQMYGRGGKKKRWYCSLLIEQFFLTLNLNLHDIYNFFLNHQNANKNILFLYKIFDNSQTDKAILVELGFKCTWARRVRMPQGCTRFEPYSCCSSGLKTVINMEIKNIEVKVRYKYGACNMFRDRGAVLDGDYKKRQKPLCFT